MRQTVGAFFVLIASSLGFVVACSDSSAKDFNDSANAAPSSSASVRDAGKTTTHGPSAELRRCAAGRREPTSIEDAIGRIDALVPADGPCVVAALPRPLAVVATLGTVSAQPAGGKNSPRLFFLLPKLVVSAVPSGPGAEVLEFGEWVSPTRTIKGELKLPVTAPLATDAAFTKVQSSEGGTLCRSCHRDEERHPTIANAFVSEAFRPEPGQLVSIADLSRLHDKCTVDEDTSERCAMLHAVFDFGQVQQGEFDPEVGTFFVP